MSCYFLLELLTVGKSYQNFYFETFHDVSGRLKNFKFTINGLQVDEYFGDREKAVIFYSKAVRLFRFLLVEAPCLILNPPFSLTNSDRYRIENYINALNKSISRSQRMAILNAEDQPRPS